VLRPRAPPRVPMVRRVALEPPRHPAAEPGRAEAGPAWPRARAPAAEPLPGAAPAPPVSRRSWTAAMCSARSRPIPASSQTPGHRIGSANRERTSAISSTPASVSSAVRTATARTPRSRPMTPGDPTATRSRSCRAIRASASNASSTRIAWHWMPGTSATGLRRRGRASWTRTSSTSGTTAARLTLGPAFQTHASLRSRATGTAAPAAGPTIPAVPPATRTSIAQLPQSPACSAAPTPAASNAGMSPIASGRAGCMTDSRPAVSMPRHAGESLGL